MILFISWLFCGEWILGAKSRSREANQESFVTNQKSVLQEVVVVVVVVEMYGFRCGLEIDSIRLANGLNVE